MKKSGLPFESATPILGVIHIQTAESAIAAAEVYSEQGVDGAFLIDNGGRYHLEQLLEIFEKVKTRFPDLWLGINDLDSTSPLDTVSQIQRLNAPIDGLWVDDARVGSEHAYNRWAEANAVRAVLSAVDDSPLYFGGTAFKYTHSYDDDPAEVAVRAARMMGVVTTSGPGTGRPIPLIKAQTMREAIPEVPIAIASGISPDNAAQLARLGSMLFIVGSYFEEDTYSGVVIPDKVKKLLDIVRSAN